MKTDLARFSEEQVENILMGNQYIEMGDLDNATRHYQLAGVEIPPEKLLIIAEFYSNTTKYSDIENAIKIYQQLDMTEKIIELGQKELSLGYLGSAAMYFEAANYRQGLITVGERFVKNGDLEDAKSIFALVGQSLSPEQLMIIGDKRIEGNSLYSAKIAYQKTGKNLTNEQLFNILDKYINYEKEFSFEGFLKEYETLGANKKFLRFAGKRYIEKAYLEKALKVYQFLGKKISARDLIAIGNKIIIKKDKMFNWYDEAKKAFGMIVFDDQNLKYKDIYSQKLIDLMIRAYRKIGEKTSKQRLIELGDTFLSVDYYWESLIAYKKTGTIEKLITAGDKYFKKGDLSAAADFYLAAGMKEKIIIVADLLLEECFNEDAIRLYQKAEAHEKITDRANHLVKWSIDYEKQGYKQGAKQCMDEARKLYRLAAQIIKKQGK